MMLLPTLLFVFCSSHVMDAVGNTNESEAREFLKNYDVEAEKQYNIYITAAWIYNTNITTENSEAMIQASLNYSTFLQEMAKNASQFEWKNFTDADVRRQFSGIVNIGISAMKNETKLIRLTSVLEQMRSIYSTGKACLKNGKCVNLQPDLYELMAKSRDYDELLDAWKSWRDASGKKMPKLYSEFVELSNEALRISGYEDTGDYWRSYYESPTFEADVKKLFDEIKPLYEQIHAYTREKLKEKYGADKFPSSGHIPAHILGDMWGQDWNNIQDIIRPFKNKPSIDITDELKKQNYTVRKMFEVSDDFFKSMGMEAMSPEFWKNSMFEQPKDGRDVVCHASAWDFRNGTDFRIKMCTVLTHTSMTTVHHEMGHVEYFMQYRHQPVIYRDGANPGFHEGVADVAALSFQTPKHLHNIGLVPELVEDEEADINFLFAMGLQKIAFLPFGYLIDQWRWSVFGGDTPPKDYNKKWWDLRCEYQGLYPPVERNDDDFDPGAKFHIPANTPYIRYFVSFIIQFQFHKELCRLANYTGPLHLCSIFNSKAAGAKFSEMLRLGSSKPWPEAMKVLTGQDKMDASALMEYFKPLLDWLKIQNARQIVGWTRECPVITAISGSRISHVPQLMVTLISVVHVFY